MNDGNELRKKKWQSNNNEKKNQSADKQTKESKSKEKATQMESGGNMRRRWNDEEIKEWTRK